MFPKGKKLENEVYGITELWSPNELWMPLRNITLSLVMISVTVLEDLAALILQPDRRIGTERSWREWKSSGSVAVREALSNAMCVTRLCLINCVFPVSIISLLHIINRVPFLPSLLPFCYLHVTCDLNQGDFPHFNLISVFVFIHFPPHCLP